MGSGCLLPNSGVLHCEIVVITCVLIKRVDCMLTSFESNISMSWSAE